MLLTANSPYFVEYSCNEEKFLSDNIALCPHITSRTSSHGPTQTPTVRYTLYSRNYSGYSLQEDTLPESNECSSSMKTTHYLLADSAVKGLMTVIEP